MNIDCLFCEFLNGQPFGSPDFFLDLISVCVAQAGLQDLCLCCSMVLLLLWVLREKWLLSKFTQVKIDHVMHTSSGLSLHIFYLCNLKHEFPSICEFDTQTKKQNTDLHEAVLGLYVSYCRSSLVPAALF